MKNPDYKLIGINIADIRKKKGLTQSFLAEAADISDTYVSHIETGRKKVSIEVLLRISNALDVPPEQLLHGVGNASVKDCDNKFNLILDGCNTYERNVICSIASSAREALKKYSTMVNTPL